MNRREWFRRAAAALAGGAIAPLAAIEVSELSAFGSPIGAVIADSIVARGLTDYAVTTARLPAGTITTGAVHE